MKKPQLNTVLTSLADPANAQWPMHARIQRAIRQLIIDGALPCLSALPASRALADTIGVSRDTVEAAYGQLHAEGLIVRRVGSGSFVSEASDFATARGKRLRQTTILPPTLGRRGCAVLGSGGVTTAPSRAFTPGVPETRRFPLAIWERLHRQVLKEKGASALAHGDPQGEEYLRRAIASYVNLERGGRATPDRVVVLTSSQQAIWLCATVLFDVGDRIVVEDPVYVGARRTFDAAALDVVPVQVDAAGMMVGDIVTRVRSAKGVYVTPSHQYPTGATLSLERRHALIEWAFTERAWLIEDDYDSEFHYGGRPMACIQGLDPHDRTIYIGTFTKSVFPALRLAYLIVPHQLVQPMVVARTLLDGFSATIPQLTLARFIEGGYFNTYLRAMREVYAERREVLVDALRARLGGMLEASPPTGGLQMSCLLTDQESEGQTIEKARSVGIELAGLSMFHSVPARGSGWLMGFAAYAPDEIKTAVAKLDLALNSNRHVR